jgi:hypothetical protein
MRTSTTSGWQELVQSIGGRNTHSINKQHSQLAIHMYILGG